MNLASNLIMSGFLEIPRANTCDFVNKVMSVVGSVYSTCQHMCGDFLSRMYWVSGEGSSSYLSKGSLSITMGSQSTQEKRTTGWAVRGGCEQRMEMSKLLGVFVFGTQSSDVLMTAVYNKPLKFYR